MANQTQWRMKRDQGSEELGKAARRIQERFGILVTPDSKNPTTQALLILMLESLEREKRHAKTQDLRHDPRQTSLFGPDHTRELVERKR